MNSFYTYKADVGERRNILVCYVASLGFDVVQFGGMIKAAFDGSPFSKQVVIISAEYNRKDILKKLLMSPEEVARLKRSINNYQTIDFYLASIKMDGAVQYDENIQ